MGYFNAPTKATGNCALVQPGKQICRSEILVEPTRVDDKSTNCKHMCRSKVCENRGRKICQSVSVGLQSDSELNLATSRQQDMFLPEEGWVGFKKPEKSIKKFSRWMSESVDARQFYFSQVPSTLNEELVRCHGFTIRNGSQKRFYSRHGLTRLHMNPRSSRHRSSRLLLLLHRRPYFRSYYRLSNLHPYLCPTRWSWTGMSFPKQWW